MIDRHCLLSPALVLVIFLTTFFQAHAQQTLGGITGTITDASGSVLPDAEVSAVADDTKLTRRAHSNAQGTYTLNDLPIGAYTVTVRHQGFTTQRFPGILVQADRTVTLPAQLKVGAVNESITVDVNPLLNAVDTTNGYVLDKQQIESIPLPTGSFTGVAILSPGVKAALPRGSGANSALLKQHLCAPGHRDTSPSFSLNGIDASNLFNGKSTSQVGSARVINSTGVSTSLGAGGVIQSVASIYLSIGNAIPTPAPETVQEVQVNASMYDAQQGSTSGAHISLSTTAGTDKFHGTLYGHRGTNWINAAPFFFKNDPGIPDDQKNPPLHRWIAGGTFGGPVLKDKLFGFVAYQHLHVSDREIGDGFLDVPIGLSDTNRTAAGFANVVSNSFCSPADEKEFGCLPFSAAQIDRTALALFNSPALPGEPGKWLVPNDSGITPTPTHPYNAFLPGTGRFKADLAVANLDYNATTKDTLSLKYYYQHDPTIAPYAFSSVPGFAEHLDSGAQVFSIINTYLAKPTLSTTETLGFIREKDWANNEQPFGPSSIPGGSLGTASINTFGSAYFPGISIYNIFGDYSEGLPFPGILNIGPNAEGQSSNTGVFQNRWQPKADAIWTLGPHTVSFGASYSYTQLNTIDHRTNAGTVATDDFSQFAQGQVTPGGSSTGFYVSSFLQGNANRYYRAKTLGTYVQDKFQITPRLSLTAGIRYDWNGGLSEKYGRLFNFEPSLYQYSASSDTIMNSGLIIAGNNANGTPGVSNTTLTGRQWGIAPRLGAAWQPEKFHGNLVVRTGFGMYYDRGELFSYFSPGYAIGTVTGGPFGVNQQLPFVTAQSCPVRTQYLYEGYIPTCGGAGNGTPQDALKGNLANPYGSLQTPPPTNPQASDLNKYLPNIAEIENYGQPVSLGVYDRTNKLPYTYNYTLDIQWQPRKDLALELGYVGYIGYAAESISYRAAGIDAYNALTAHLEKRMSHGIQLAVSYTYSHALDEQSGLGLFYNGNNPLNLRDGYASADFDRTHVINFNYVFQMPNLIHEHNLASYFANGWSLVGLTVLQSGQPYSVIDFSGAVGSVYYSTANGITNPIVPLVNGCTAKSAKTGKSGAFGDEALRSECFGVPLIAPGAFNGGIPSNDPYETDFTTGQRNIFRQAFQRRADASIVKLTKFNERYTLKYTFDIYNLTNTSSFDVPGNEVAQNEFYDEAPQAGTPPSEFYNAPYGLGVVGHTIGSARQIQMSLQLVF